MSSAGDVGNGVCRRLRRWPPDASLASSRMGCKGERHGRGKTQLQPERRGRRRPASRARSCSKGARVLPGRRAKRTLQEGVCAAETISASEHARASRRYDRRKLRSRTTRCAHARRAARDTLMNTPKRWQFWIDRAALHRSSARRLTAASRRSNCCPTTPEQYRTPRWKACAAQSAWTRASRSHRARRMREDGQPRWPPTRCSSAGRAHAAGHDAVFATRCASPTRRGCACSSAKHRAARNAVQ